MKYKLAQLIDVPLNGWSEHSIQTNNGFVSVMIKRLATEWTAFVNECPHQGRRMDYAENAFLETPEHYLVCPAHGATFDVVDGECKTGPCVGQSLKKLTVEIDNKDVYVWFR